jgi:hypothetical protein
MMISKPFISGSASYNDVVKLRKDTCFQVDAIINELELLKKENKLLAEMVSEHQLSINILIAANQSMMEELQLLQNILLKSSGDNRRFSFNFRDKNDDDLPN